MSNLTQKAAKARLIATRENQLMREALARIEAVLERDGGYRPEHLQLLDSKTRPLLRGVLDDLVRNLDQGKRIRVAKIGSVSYPLKFSNFGRVMICSPRTGRPLISTGFLE